MYDLTPPSLITAVCTEVSVVSPVVSSQGLVRGKVPQDVRVTQLVTGHTVQHDSLAEFVRLDTGDDGDPRASLVLLGASALHSDGALFARSGTAVVSMLAKALRAKRAPSECRADAPRRTSEARGRMAESWVRRT
jgi:hypothetical protein